MESKDAKGSAFDEVRKMLHGGLTSKLAKKFTPDELKPEEKKPVAVEVSVTKAEPKPEAIEIEGSPEEESHETPEEEKLEADAASTPPDLKSLIAEHVAGLLPKPKKKA